METSAVAQVLRLPELLELILLHFTQKDLLLAQRVCRSFRVEIQCSIRLQRALFLAPNWKLEGRAYNAYSAHNHPGQKPENNRLLFRAFSGNFPVVIVNDSPTPNEVAIGWRGSQRRTWDVCISFPADSAPVCSDAVARPEASWRKMYLSQPPCIDLHLVRRYLRSSNAALSREGGITMGDFVEELTDAKEKQSWHHSFISSDREWHFEGSVRCSSPNY